MVGLLDILPAHETVKVGGTDVQVGGLSIKDIALLMGRFPTVRDLLSGNSVGAEDVITTCGDAVGAIIACGCNLGRNAQAEEIAARLTIGEQLDLLSAIIRLTVPEGFGPFAKKLEAIGLKFSAQPEAPLSSASASVPPIPVSLSNGHDPAAIAH